MLMPGETNPGHVTTETGTRGLKREPFADCFVSYPSRRQQPSGAHGPYPRSSAVAPQSSSTTSSAIACSAPPLRPVRDSEPFASGGSFQRFSGS